MLNRVLLVDPRREVLRHLHQAWNGVMAVQTSQDFVTARTQLLANPPDLLVTNLRLGAHNGLHLVLLARVTGAGPRAVVYLDAPEPWAIREARVLGAFCESTGRLPAAVPSYASKALPPIDRRNDVGTDRRGTIRGGRRATDLVPPAGDWTTRLLLPLRRGFKKQSRD